MSKEMKLIMENWRVNILNEDELPPCDTSSVTFGDFAGLSLWIAAKGKEEKQQALKKIKSTERAQSTLDFINNTASTVGPIIAAAGMGLASVGAASATFGLSIAATTAAAILLGVFRKNQEQKAGEAEAEVSELMRYLCIDEALLDTVDNSIEMQYIKTSGVLDLMRKEMKEYFDSGRDQKMKDFTSHFIHWLNNSEASVYSRSGDNTVVEK